jgi:hypothetical protein
MELFRLRLLLRGIRTEWDACQGLIDMSSQGTDRHSRYHEARGGFHNQLATLPPPPRSSLARSEES